MVNFFHVGLVGLQHHGPESLYLERLNVGRVLVTLAVMGLDHGPWSTARWWAELKASAQEYISISSSDCPILSELDADVATVELDSNTFEGLWVFLMLRK